MITLIEYAKSFVGTPYKWGGQNPNGMDCSGLVIEILDSVGAAPDGCRTAQQLHDFHKGFPQRRGAGVLAFFGKDAKSIHHVGFMIDEVRMIESAPGGANIETKEDADKANAFVRIRPYFRRNDFLAGYSPIYAGWMVKI